MPINVSWYNEAKTILHIQYIGKWTLDDFHAMLENSTQMTRNSSPFVVIGDFTESSMTPNGLLAASPRIEQTTPPHRLLLILVQPGLMMQMLMKAVSAVHPKAIDNATVVGSFDEAVKLAHETLAHS